jgi:transposase-like protein
MTERELERRANRRLAVLRHVEEVSGNVAATCRYYGISRQCYYGWLRRYEADGLDGLKDRSSRPHHSPRVTQAEVIEKIVWLRKHYLFGRPRSRCIWPATTAGRLVPAPRRRGRAGSAGRSAICAAVTPSTPSPTGWIPSCWPGCRCCTPTACMPSRGSGRLDALLEILGPAWHAAIGADLANRTPLKFLAA